MKKLRNYFYMQKKWMHLTDKCGKYTVLLYQVQKQAKLLYCDKSHNTFVGDNYKGERERNFLF